MLANCVTDKNVSDRQQQKWPISLGRLEPHDDFRRMKQAMGKLLGTSQTEYEDEEIDEYGEDNGEGDQGQITLAKVKKAERKGKEKSRSIKVQPMINGIELKWFS